MLFRSVQFGAGAAPGLGAVFRTGKPEGYSAIAVLMGQNFEGKMDVRQGYLIG